MKNSIFLYMPSKHSEVSKFTLYNLFREYACILYANRVVLCSILI